MGDVVSQARAGLLDALDALKDHLDALVLVGAQAVYLHTGSARVALAEYTTDGDLAVDPELLGSEPRVEAAMRAAGFTSDPREGALGTWFSPAGVPVDLMVPAAVAGPGRRGVRVPPHGSKSMRRARGLEASLVDRSKRKIESLDSSGDGRSFEVSVAGPAALLIAKLHKLNDRRGQPSRLDNKDAHDVYRLLQAVDTSTLAKAYTGLLEHELAGPVAREALGHLKAMFANGPECLGSSMAGAAEELVGDPTSVAVSVSILSGELLHVVSSQA